MSGEEKRFKRFEQEPDDEYDAYQEGFAKIVNRADSLVGKIPKEDFDEIIKGLSRVELAALEAAAVNRLQLNLHYARARQEHVKFDKQEDDER